MKSKVLVPIIIAAIFVLFFLYIIILTVLETESMLAGFMSIAIYGAFICVMIFVTYKRIKEIESGEEDDISKY